MVRMAWITSLIVAVAFMGSGTMQLRSPAFEVGGMIDTMLDLLSTTTKQDLERAMHGHILGQAELIGKFRR